MAGHDVPVGPGDEPGSMTVAVENVGGIRSRRLALDRGVSLLTGRNATNRTSLLRAIGAGLGGTTGELRTDADTGSVTLDIDGEASTRTFERDGQSVRVGGDPYTDDATVVDQYSCLLADNPGREAVERGDGDALREFIMAPVDTDDITATIERTQREIRSLSDDLAEAERQRDRRADVERELEDRRDQLATVRSDLESVRADVATREADVDDAQAAEAVVEDLASAREEYERVRDRLETQRNALESLRDERDDLEGELADVAAPEADRDRIQADLERLQRRERELETTVTNLLSIVEFNEDLLAGSDVPDVTVPDGADGSGAGADTGTGSGADADTGTGSGAGADGGGDGDGAGGGGEAASGTETGTVAAALNPGTRTVTCWTCGTRVDRASIDDRLDDLRDVVDEKRAERNELRTRIADRRSDLEDVRSTLDRRQSLEARIEDVDGEIDDRESRVADLESRATDLEDRIADLESRAAESDDLRDSDLLERYQRLSELEYQRGQLEEAIDSLEAERAEIDEAADRVADLEARLAERRETLESARTRIDELERAAVETFNDHMETVLDLLGYGNVERVWIERTGADGDASAAAAERTFTLHVVRSTPDGAVYEDTVDHLSESERAVIGLVVALAGYLVHDVHESVPVVVLDSLEAIDADRIAALVEYFAEFVPFLVVALLPEDAAALPERYDRVRMGEAPA